MSITPPLRAERLVRWSLAPWERAAILGDLNEEFLDLEHGSGASLARRWYWRQTLLSIWPNLLRRLKGDEERLRHAKAGLGYLGLAAFFGTVDLLQGEVPWLALIWMSTGTLLVVDNVFRKRPVRPKRTTTVPQRVLVAAFVAAAFLLAVVASAYRWSGPLTNARILSVLLAANGAVFFWPRRTQESREFAVRHKLTPELEPAALLTVAVPKDPFGLSRVVLRRPAVADGHGEGAASSALHIYDPIISRSFTPEQTVRVFAIANLPERHGAVSASVDVVESSGQIAKRVFVPVVDGQLQQVGPWEDFADEDPAEHFGQIDAPIPLEGLAAGEYTLRISVGDGAAHSIDDEPISIVAK